MLERETTDAELLSSVLLVVEANRNLIRLSREGALDAHEFHACLARVEQDVALFALRDVNLALCAGTSMPVVVTPRSLDLVHLRTALRFHAERPLSRFVTLDATQESAARELGLPI
jgi:hypothetical protein